MYYVVPVATKKVENIKHDVEHLCDHHALRDATPNIHQKLRECTELCDSARKMLAEECQELETEHKKLMKEKEDLNEKLITH